MIATDISEQGTLEDKLRWAFRIYDKDMSGDMSVCIYDKNMSGDLSFCIYHKNMSGEIFFCIYDKNM